jgi:hypothetical protein
MIINFLKIITILMILGLPSWTGNYCETLVCSKEPLQCKDPLFFSKKDCSLSIIAFYCPVLCGKCSGKPNIL